MPKCAASHVGAQTQLGRLDAATLDALADLASTHAQGRLLITPWQGVLVPDVAAQHEERVLARMNALGLITNASHLLARFVACAGSAGCAKSRADTKADAHRLAALLSPKGDVHLSGCERSCAAAHPVATTLIAVSTERYDLHVDARLVARNLSIEEAAAWLARSHADA
jgi:precorrin-3B synthase